MCGIVGVIINGKNGFFQDQITSFEQMLLVDQLRGRDGTGVFYNLKKNKPTVTTLRGAMDSYQFVNSKEFGTVCKTLFSDSNFIIGHNRAATKGKIAFENTHPFKEKHITLVHNGTLTSHKELADTDVDSHAIAVSIATIGAEETLKKIDGAFALVWFNSQEGTLNLCRNYQRPLHIIECETCHLVSSELELALWIAKRNNLKIVKSFQLEPKKLYQFDIKDMSSFTVKDVEYKSYTEYGGYYVGNRVRTSPAVTSSSPFRKSFAIGEKVRFKGGLVRFTNSNNTPFLEGDILKWQQLGCEHVRADDWEDAWRLRWMDVSQESMEALKNAKFLVGKIAAAYTYDLNTWYTVTDIEVEAADSVYNPFNTKLPATTAPKKEPETKKGTAKCQICDDEMNAQEGEWYHEFFACKSCREHFGQACGMC